MNRTRLIVTSLLLLTLATAVACAPTVQEPVAAPTEPAGEPGGAATPDAAGAATVEDVQLLVMESMPVQVAAEISGNLPDGCTTIADVAVNRADNTFNVELVTQRDPDAVCTQALVPFSERIALDVLGLEAGAYTVNVQGTTETFELAVDNVPQEEPTAVPAALKFPEACFPETDLNAPFINLADGYCVQYAVQDGFRVKDVFLPGIAAIWGEPLTPGFEPLRAGLTIQKQGPANGRSLDEVVDEVLAQNTEATVVDAEATFAGEPAQVVEGLPGMMDSRHTFLIHNDFVYEITLVPLTAEGELAEEVLAQRDQLWQTAMETFTWLPQPVIEQFSACPTGTQDASPFVSVTDAYCLRYPSYFRQQQFFSEGEARFFSLEGDPTVPEPVFATLHVEVTDAADGRSLEQIVDEIAAKAEGLEITRAEAMLGGEPALIVEGLPARNVTRHAYALHDGKLYHLWVEPLDIAEAADAAEAAWQTALASFTFVR